jgi:hypothetical protein
MLYGMCQPYARTLQVNETMKGEIPGRAPSHLIFLERHAWQALVTLSLCLRKGFECVC